MSHLLRHVLGAQRSGITGTLELIRITRENIMIFENSLMTIFSFLITNQIISYFVYSNYEIINNNNIAMINLNIVKYALILPIIALIYEVVIIIKHYNREDYCHKKLKKRICKIEDKNQIKSILISNIIFILGIIIFYIFKKQKEPNNLFSM